MIWAQAIVAAAAVATVGGAYLYGRQAGKDACAAAVAREEHVAQVATAAAASAAAGAIARLRVQHVTIRQEAEREIQTRVEYRDCRHSPEQLQRLNAALTGTRAEPAGGDELPAADTPE